MCESFTIKECENVKKLNDTLIIENQRLSRVIRERNLIIVNLEKTIMDFGDPDY